MVRIRVLALVTLSLVLFGCAAEEDPLPLTPDAACAANGETFCGFGCVDLASDPLNCGSCLNACGDGEICGDGICACPDADADGACDVDDGCADDPAKTEPGTCGCGVPDVDGDGDATLDCEDGCPLDVNKLEPGSCGCGLPDVDTDGDGALDCHDACPSDALKIDAGICGCGVADDDTDFDGTADCNDGCPQDALKIASGICGCGISDDDADGDGAVCDDLCPFDANKAAPGVCGCGVPDAGQWGPELADDGLDNDCSDGDLVASDATGVFVAENGDDANPGTKAEPKATLSEANAVALAESKVVFVARGLYAHNNAANVVVSTYGGYTPGTWQRDVAANPTIVESDSAAMQIAGDAVVEGLVIRTTSASTSCLGVRISSHDQPIEVHLVGNTITPGACKSSTGVHVWGWSDGSLVDAHVVGNDIQGGEGTSYITGVSIDYGAHAVVEGNTIDCGDHPTGYTTGISVEYDGASAEILNNVVLAGRGVGNGYARGIEANYDATVFVANNYVHGGLGANYAHAITIGEATATIVNNIIDPGEALVQKSHGIRVSSLGTTTVVNNDIHGATADCLLRDGGNTCINNLNTINACSWSGCGGAQGNLSVAPMLVGGGDYHLLTQSPLVDAGVDPSAYGFPVGRDIDGDARPAGAGWDIGPDER